MTAAQLARELAKREGLKKQVDIAQIKEIIGHLADMLDEEFLNETVGYPMLDMLNELGHKRRLKREKYKRIKP